MTTPCVPSTPRDVSSPRPERRARVFLIATERVSRELWADAMMDDAVLPAPSDYDHVASMTLLSTVADDAMVLEAVYGMTQNDIAPDGWLAALRAAHQAPATGPAGVRSLSCGDLCCLDGRWYRVCEVGFRALDDAATVRAFDLAFPGAQ